MQELSFYDDAATVFIVFFFLLGEKKATNVGFLGDTAFVSILGPELRAIWRRLGRPSRRHLF